MIVRRLHPMTPAHIQSLLDKAKMSQSEITVILPADDFKDIMLAFAHAVGVLELISKYPNHSDKSKAGKARECLETIGYQEP